MLEQRIYWLWLLLSGRCWWLIPTLSFAALGAVNFSYFADTLFYRFDGIFILTMVTTQNRWMAPGVELSLNFLEGLGDIWIPIITSLIPGFFLGGLLDNDHWMPVIACFTFAMEFFLSTLIFGWCAGAGRVTTLAAALIGALFTLPFFIPTLAAWRIWGSPYFMTAIAMTTLTLCAFLTIGRTRMRTDIALVTAILALQSYLIVSQPGLAAIAAVMLAFFGTAALLGAEGKDERRRKLIAAGLIVAILVSAFGGYLFGLFYYARTTFFWNDIASFPVDWTQQSFLISEGRVAGPYIWGACLAGAVISAWREHGRLRLLALTFLVFVAVQQAIFLTLQLANATWSGPPTAYIDMFALPFYALFGAYLLIGSWAQTSERTRWTMLALVIVPWGSVLTLYKPYSVLFFHQQNPFLWPPHHTPITRQLQDEIGLTDGSPFRGRVANIGGTERDPQYSWLPLISQHYYDAVVALYTGNDHRYFGLWYFGIPTLIADNQFSSPFFHVINSRLLSNSDQKHVRQLTTITRFEPRILAMLGVRFVITSRPLAGLTPKSAYVVVPEHPDTWSLFLYELSDAKIAGYWATRPTKVETTRQAMLWMVDPASAADSTVYEPLQTSLVAGTASQLLVFQNHLIVEAESPGTSLLVLPVEFSHCFDVRFRDSDQARFLRANINQGALLFSGRLRAELRYRYAPWHFGCRLRDIEDARHLKLSEVGWPQ